MDPITTALCIGGIVIGVGIICYVLLRTPKAPAHISSSEIIIGDAPVLEPTADDAGEGTPATDEKEEKAE